LETILPGELTIEGSALCIVTVVVAGASQ
jgi:hypothetical protein